MQGDSVNLYNEALTEYRKGLGLVELSNKVGLNKTTTYRMLCAIMTHGFDYKGSSHRKLSSDAEAF